MKSKKFISYGRKISSKDISLLCKQFSVLLAAGINISEVLNILSKQLRSKRMRKYMYELYEDIQKGEELSVAIEKHSNVFPRFMINMIKVGEQSGNLEKIFNTLSQYYSNDNSIKRKIKDALRYPMVVFVMTIVIFLFLMTKVVPAFAATLTPLGAKLPAITRNLLFISNVITNNIFYILLGSFVIVVAVAFYNQTNSGKSFLFKLRLKIPFVRGIYRRVLTVNFSKYLSILLSSGFNMITSLQVLSEIMGNIEMEKKIKLSIDNIKVGENLAYSIEKIGVFEPLLNSLVAVGEECGRIEEMLSKTAEIYEEEVYEMIEKGTKAIEPTMIVILAFFIGTIVLSIVLPMVSVMDNMGG